MNTSSALVVAAAIVAVGLFLSGGIYAASASSTNFAFNAIIYNKFTGQPAMSCSATGPEMKCMKIAVEPGR